MPKKNISFLWLLSQPFLQDCSLAASDVDLGEHEATALCSIIYWTYSAVTALASLLWLTRDYLRCRCLWEVFVYLHLTQLNSKKQQRMNFLSEALLLSNTLEQKLFSLTKMGWKDLSVIKICHLSSSVAKQARNFCFVCFRNREHVSFLMIFCHFSFTSHYSFFFFVEAGKNFNEKKGRKMRKG